MPSQDVCPLDDTRLVPGTGALPAGVGRQLGAYELVCLLGEGGMGNIYIGRHQQLGRFVAIKVLRAELANRKDNISRFFQEAHTINRLRHPNIVESLDLVEDVVDGAYCVLELLKGPDLKARLSRGALEIESAIHIGTQLADALGKVHAIGVVHRDLKPENLILIERDGHDDFVKLIDFGVAQIGQTEAGVFGTAAYMAPEQANRGATVDRRADIYALGVMLFEMVAGRHPFPSNTDSEYLVQHADTKPPRPSKLNDRCPPELEAVILRCLEKRPEARYASADEVAAALRMVDPGTRSRSRVSWIAAGALLVCGVGAAAAVLVPRYLDSKQASAPDQTTTAEPTPTPDATAPTQPSTPPTESPPPAPIAVAPATVEIGVVSSPKGASVYRAHETVALGVTPFTVPLPRSDKPVEMRFEKAGYQSKTIEVALDASAQIEVALAKEREPVAAKSSVKVRTLPEAAPDVPKPKKVQREGVMDPFAKP